MSILARQTRCPDPYDADKGRDYAQRLGVAADRAYGNWREMLDGEQAREDRGFQ